MGAGSFPGVKCMRHGLDHLPFSSAEVKERVYPYLYPQFPLCAFMAGYRTNFIVYPLQRYIILDPNNSCNIPQYSECTIINNKE
jgi:hypothetical protein